MRAYLQQLIYRISGTYWFVPAIMAFAALVFSQLMIWIDHRVGLEWSRSFWFTVISQPDGARALLATVSGSMITVAGVTFSLTMVAVSHASSHFGPRILANFMHDRGNQITLGTFLATFLYCLLVLRVVRAADEVSGDGLALDLFVPHISIGVALLLTLASVGQLIYFFHHVPASIHISTILKKLSREMVAKIAELFPETVENAGPDEDTLDFQPMEQFQLVRSQRHGYLQGIDRSELLGIAKTQDTRIQLERSVGDFVRQGEPIAKLECLHDLDADVEASICQSITLGVNRTPPQDVLFTFDEMIEIAVRALSPGVNDPFTAMQCIDWLTAGLTELSRRSLPPHLHADQEGQVRLRTQPFRYEELTAKVIDRFLVYASRDPNVSDYLHQSLERMLTVSRNQELNASIQAAMVRHQPWSTLSERLQP